METRDEMFFKLIKWLNDKGEMGTTHLFDCEELGFALIYWRHRWEVSWYDPEPVPEELRAA